MIDCYLPRSKTAGRPRAGPLREIVNAMFYVLRGGLAWGFRFTEADIVRGTWCDTVRLGP